MLSLALDMRRPPLRGSLSRDEKSFSKEKQRGRGEVDDGGGAIGLCEQCAADRRCAAPWRGTKQNIQKKKFFAKQRRRGAHCSPEGSPLGSIGATSFPPKGVHFGVDVVGCVAPFTVLL